MALTMLAGLFLFKLKLGNRKEMPLLSCTYLKELLATIIPRQASRLESVWALILQRHRRRRAAIQYRYHRKGAKPPDEILTLALTLTGLTGYLTM